MKKANEDGAVSDATPQTHLSRSVDRLIQSELLQTIGVRGHAIGETAVAAKNQAAYLTGVLTSCVMGGDSGLPKCFLGISTDGPSREGFFFSPIYRINGDGQGHALKNHPPRIFPDGKPHEWNLDYSLTDANDRGEITVTLD